MWNPKQKYVKGGLDNFTDKWVIASNQKLINQVEKEMDKYMLYKVVPRLLDFLYKLSKCYVRFNHNRLKGEKGEQEQITSLNMLFEVLLNTCIVMAPYVPFITEFFY